MWPNVEEFSKKPLFIITCIPRCSVRKYNRARIISNEIHHSLSKSLDNGKVATLSWSSHCFHWCSSKSVLPKTLCAYISSSVDLPLGFATAGTVPLRDKTGSHGRLAIFQLFEVISPIKNHLRGKKCIFSSSAWNLQHFEGCYMLVAWQKLAPDFLASTVCSPKNAQKGPGIKSPSRATLVFSIWR